ncbi:MAG: DegT/DnrJ/EryC1/StrS family aminotransferase [Geminicoccaceae bacterium]|jgi:dTDP-4-amino-4,6-dideoxygalactose transaminase|nr:DegT/DnrJ/EryC1/StrS family aminotransferase [Geminicoccaceae bacterium]MCB9967187.1 DegT/DnrJ/EryC1/StrS family aminotransferase [Geminicoccaceae bacterium]HRY25204.1 DegT/DnrJ/EryC1/StrS family aminotransferase [Geminicoccaceae bacterium]
MTAAADQGVLDPSPDRTRTTTPGRVFLSPPHMAGDELALLHEVFATNYVAPAGPMLSRFEAAMAALTGFHHCLAVVSGTAALHLALRHLGVGPGDRVIAADLTFIGGVAPIGQLGAEPIFVDADPETWCMNPGLLAEALAGGARQGRLPKAVVPCDLYGQACDLDALRAVTDAYEIPLIADSAEALGATYRGRHAGKGARAALYSFNGNKIVTAGGGGMLASDDAALIEHARGLSQQARQPVPHYEHVELGYNYRLSNVLAAIGVGQLAVLDDRVRQRRAIFSGYQQRLGRLDGITFMPEAGYGRANRWLTCILIEPRAFGADREAVRLALEAQDIEARPLWRPMHMQPVFAGATCFGGGVGKALFDQGLCLPSGSALGDGDLDRICEVIRGCARP